MGKLVVLLGLIAVAMAGPVDVDPAFDFNWQGPPNYERTALGDSIDKSTFQLLKAAYDSAQDKNVVSSPLSLMTLLSLYNNGAGAGTQQEITKFLGETDYKKATDDYKQLSNQFSSMDPDYLTLANKIYVSDKLALNEQFQQTARDYRSDVENINFDNTNEAAAIINRWADEKTKGNIKEPVSADALEGAITALCNVIFFKGHWSVPFKAEDTQDKDFHVSKSEKVKKPMMHLLQSLYYTESEELGAKMIELPYKEKGFRMVVVLPNEVDGLPSVLEKVASKGLLTDVFKLSPAGRDVDLDMPKFEVKSKLDFNTILPKIGVSKLFDEPANGIVKGVPVKVSKAFQEAFIKVDEEGATAGAFTGLVAVPMSSWSRPPPPMKFTVDHGFLYALLYEDKILFAGTYTK